MQSSTMRSVILESRRRSRFRITPTRKLCAGFAAYRIENANLFFAFPSLTHGKNVLRPAGSTDNISPLVEQPFEVMEENAADQAVARGLLNRAQEPVKKVHDCKQGGEDERQKQNSHRR